MTTLEQQVINHLAIICPTAKTIERAQSLNNVPDLVNDLPAIYVIELDYDAEPPQFVNSNRQLLYRRLLLQLAGTEADLEQLKSETNALKQFKPVGYQRGLYRASGKFLDVKPSSEWWSELWIGQVYES